MEPRPVINFAGSVRPPSDLVAAARRSMSEKEFDEFIAKFGEGFTVEQLCQFCDEIRGH